MLYLVDGRFRIGTVEQVMNTRHLSMLYRADIQVVKVKDRYVVVGDQPDRLRRYELRGSRDAARPVLFRHHRPLLSHDFVQQALLAAALLGWSPG